MHAHTQLHTTSNLCFRLDFSTWFLDNRLFTSNGTTSWMSLLVIGCALWPRPWLLWSRVWRTTIKRTCKASLLCWLYISGEVPNTLYSNTYKSWLVHLLYYYKHVQWHSNYSLYNLILIGTKYCVVLHTRNKLTVHFPGAHNLNYYNNSLPLYLRILL